MSSSEMKLIVKKLSSTATLPKRGSQHAAGYDLASAKKVTVPARGKALVKTDLAMIIPEGCYGRIAPRSGLAWKKFIDIGAGVIDRDYRGNVGVVMFNHGDQPLEVEVGDRIAQLVLERIAEPVVEEVEELPETERGSGGFGSTGVKRKLEEAEKNEPKKATQNENNILLILAFIGLFLVIICNIFEFSVQDAINLIKNKEEAYKADF